MGSGSMVVKNYRRKANYYSDNYINHHGEREWFIIEPLIANEEHKRFFYVKELEDGQFEVEGEGYFIWRKNTYLSHLRELKEEKDSYELYYYFLDKTGHVYREEKQEETI